MLVPPVSPTVYSRHNARQIERFWNDLCEDAKGAAALKEASAAFSELHQAAVRSYTEARVVKERREAEAAAAKSAIENAAVNNFKTVPDWKTLLGPWRCSLSYDGIRFELNDEPLSPVHMAKHVMPGSSVQWVSASLAAEIRDFIGGGLIPEGQLRTKVHAGLTLDEQVLIGHEEVQFGAAGRTMSAYLSVPYTAFLSCKLLKWRSSCGALGYRHLRNERIYTKNLRIVISSLA